MFKDIKQLGFGLMRLPLIGGKIDYNQVKLMIDVFIEHGYSYFDTAPGYMNGYSEGIIKDYLTKIYPRKMFQVATKMPAWDSSRINDKKDVIKVFEKSLQDTGVDYFDFYLMHNIGEERTKIFDKYNVWEYINSMKESGVIKNLGISFHGKSSDLKNLLMEHPEIDFVQLQINYADWVDSVIDSEQCHYIACQFKKPIIVMEPLKGGTLCKLPDAITSSVCSKIPLDLPSLGFRWVQSLDNIHMVLSGMSSIEQIRSNINIFDNLERLTSEEHKMILNIQRKVKELRMIPCTGCKYCRHCCPVGIPINEIIAALNILYVFNNTQAASNKYRFQTREGALATLCCNCGKCVQNCPQMINIPHYMNIAKKIFDE